MKEHFDLRILKNAELLLRLAMIITLLVAGISKFCSSGNFYNYYSKQFSDEGLRINLPSFMFNFYLVLIPFLEVGIAAALVTLIQRRFFIVVWVLYFITLQIGHYMLEEFTSVNSIVPYLLVGVSAYILPAYDSYGIIKRKK